MLPASPWRGTAADDPAAHVRWPADRVEVLVGGRSAPDVFVEAPARHGGGVRAKDLLARAISAAHVTAYRVSGGRVAGRLAGMPVLLLTTSGRRTGRPHTVPLTFFEDGGAVVLVASYAGDDRDPGWYRNLLAGPDVEVTRGGRREPMTARPATPDERARLWPTIMAAYDGYRRYQERTAREIPLAVLTPRAVRG